MRWWAKNRLVLLILAATSGTELARGLLGNRRVPLINFSLGSVSVALELLLPIVPTVFLAAGLARAPRIESAGARVVSRLDASLCAAVVLAGGLTAWSVEAISGSAGLHSGVAVRNLAGLIGIMLLSARYTGTAASSGVACAYVLVAGFFGIAADHHVRWWAFVLAGSRSASTWLLAGSLFTAGLAADRRNV